MTSLTQCIVFVNTMHCVFIERMPFLTPYPLKIISYTLRAKLY